MEKVKLYIKYPLSSVLIYNGSTIAHFLLGGMGIIIGYNFAPLAGYTLGILYSAFAFIEMYILMPLKVCPSCVYYKAKDSLCVSGLNVLSKKIANEGDLNNFSKRAEGILCYNNIYIAFLAIPILAIIPALIINYTTALLIIFASIITLLIFRFFIIFPKIACLHCTAKYKCPQAGAMGVREL